jgi:amidophosphoribosyltransferase
MPQNQEVRNLVARMKLMPIPEVVEGNSLLLCDDSIVRGTQLRETVELLYNCNAKEVHIRSACPPLVFGCKFLNFSTSKSEMDLVARQVIIDIEGKEPQSLKEYCDPDSEKYGLMIEGIKKRLNLSTLKFQNVHDMVDAIGIGAENLCTYCWTGKE